MSIFAKPGPWHDWVCGDDLARMYSEGMNRPPVNIWKWARRG